MPRQQAERRAGISNRLAASEEARERAEQPPLTSPVPEDAGEGVGDISDVRNQQTSRKAGSRSLAQKEAEARYDDGSMPASRHVPGAFGREPTE